MARKIDYRTLYKILKEEGIDPEPIRYALNNYHRKEYAKQTREKRREYERQYYEQHKEQRAETMRKYRSKNLEKMANNHREWVNANREYLKAYRREYSKRKRADKETDTAEA